MARPQMAKYKRRSTRVIVRLTPGDLVYYRRVARWCKKSLSAMIRDAIRFWAEDKV
jgi:hypothetical protein